ncbi:MAG: metallophosphoesterase [Anaerolineae bacterium]|nr:metallophosphoesterase [Anaerolineae bacterium]RIK24039.1 MAG: metallophosphoesterase [Anaerolineae bacterium]
MRILAVSDRVLDKLYSGQTRRMFPDIDLIIGCGDLPFYYLDFLTSALDAPLVFVRGNHDGIEQYAADGSVWRGVRGGVDIHGKIVTHKGLILAGMQGSMRYKSRSDYMYSESEMRMVVAQMVPRLLWNRQRFGRALDILVTHSPPFGIHDRPDLPHTGFKVFLSFLRMFKPRYHLHGHIHIYRQDEITSTVFEETQIENVYPYRLLEVE